MSASLLRDKVLQGDCLDVLRGLPDNYVDAVVTDPPAGIAFMGKDWDRDKGGRDAWIAWLSEVMGEALRVLKPGGHVLVWALPRTSHWTGMAMEDAGFEVREKLAHWFGSGFPKSRNLHGEHEGWGTALKPAYEDWWLCRKPLAAPTVAAQVLATGTGALNIAACRVPHDEDASRQQHQHAASSGMRGIGVGGFKSNHTQSIYNTEGRWPPNLLLSHAATCDAEGCAEGCPARELDAQSGPRQAGNFPARLTGRSMFGLSGLEQTPRNMGDAGGASRFYPQFRHDIAVCPLCRKHGIMTATQQTEDTPCDATYAVTSSNPSAPVSGIVPARAQARRRRGNADSKASTSTPASSAVSRSLRLPATIGTIAPTSADESPVAQIARAAKSAASLCDSCATAIAQSLVPMLHGHCPASLLGADCMPASSAYDLRQSLAQYAAHLESNGTIPTMADLMTWCGSVLPAIIASIHSAATVSEHVRVPFLYQSKASRRERNAGCEGLPERRKDSAYGEGFNSATKVGTTAQAQNGVDRGTTTNSHPTVKPLALMRWLVRLITPPGGLVLDPFAGSGSTLVACVQVGAHYLGIEREAEYVAIARARVAAAAHLPEVEVPDTLPVPQSEAPQPAKRSRRKPANVTALPVPQPSLWEVSA